jgi:hypothetical protein
VEEVTMQCGRARLIGCSMQAGVVQEAGWLPHGGRCCGYVSCPFSFWLLLQD